MIKKVVFLIFLFNLTLFSKDFFFLNLKDWNSFNVEKETIGFNEVKSKIIFKKYENNNKKFKLYVIKGEFVNHIWLPNYNIGYKEQNERKKLEIQRYKDRIFAVEEDFKEHKNKIYCKIKDNLIVGIEYINMDFNKSLTLLLDFIKKNNL